MTLFAGINVLLGVPGVFSVVIVGISTDVLFGVGFAVFRILFVIVSQLLMISARIWLVEAFCLRSS